MSESVGKATRNSDWSRDELILALELYLKHPKGLPPPSHPEVIALSALLNQISSAEDNPKNATHRNTNGVAMKLGNFQRLDPVYIESGRKGLSRGNKNEIIIWEKFSTSPEKLRATADAIRLMITAPSLDNKSEAIGEDWVTEAPEGRLLTRAHKVRERNKAIVESKKKEAIQKVGRLECEACGCDFEKTYGDVGRGLIEVHHTKPLHTLKPNAKTKLQDLALLCANCHRVVHSRRNWLTVEEVKMHYSKNFRKGPTASPIDQSE
jgi:5-methylcytosine-specific restriction protein A